MIDIAQDYPNIINSGYYDDEKLEQSVRYRFIDEVKKYYSLNRDNVLLNKDLPQEFKDYLDFMLGNQNNEFKEIIQSNEKILNQLI